MPETISRRRLLQWGAASPLMLTPLEGLAQGAGLHFGPAQPFSFAALTARAEAMAAADYRPPYRPAPELVAQIDYDAHGKIRFDPALALFGPQADGARSAYPATFFHLGQLFGKSVKMHAVGGGEAREVLYSPTYFSMPADSVARRLPEDSGFAGFRLQESTGRDDWRTHDWVAFLGASYFRAIGALGQYGLSARGIAVDTAATGPEEFPDFTEFYIGAAAEGAPVEVCALLDGPSIAGAYRFVMTREPGGPAGGVVMEVEARLFLRRAVERLGIAPLTSMYWYSEGSRRYRVDWRPEVHDSDGLALWTGSGERIWRPLNNPERIIVSSFVDENPRGFGLLQRDRNFAHYLDGVHYERRPSLWVEPLDPWGPGTVQLVEIPTDDEIHDNIAAFWVPRAPAAAGDRHHLRYRLYWQADEPFAAPGLARATATRLGRGGEPGHPRPPGVIKFVIDFAGGALADLSPGRSVEARVNTTHGQVTRAVAEPVAEGGGWRAVFDLALEEADQLPVELRLHLADDNGPLSETWLYQYRPGATARI